MESQSSSPSRSHNRLPLRHRLILALSFSELSLPVTGLAIFHPLLRTLRTLDAFVPVQNVTCLWIFPSSCMLSSWCIILNINSNHTVRSSRGSLYCSIPLRGCPSISPSCPVFLVPFVIPIMSSMLCLLLRPPAPRPASSEGHQHASADPTRTAAIKEIPQAVSDVLFAGRGIRPDMFSGNRAFSHFYAAVSYNMWVSPGEEAPPMDDAYLHISVPKAAAI